MALGGSNKRRSNSPAPLSSSDERSCSRIASNMNSSAEDDGLNRRRDSTPDNVPEPFVDTRKKRRTWTKELHQRFVRVVVELGGHMSK